jgi:hypothetical protein
MLKHDLNLESYRKPVGESRGKRSNIIYLASTAAGFVA